MTTFPCTLVTRVARRGTVVTLRWDGEMQADAFNMTATFRDCPLRRSECADVRWERFEWMFAGNVLRTAGQSFRADINGTLLPGGALILNGIKLTTPGADT